MGNERKEASATNQDAFSKQNSDNQDEAVGQGKLYSPEYAIKVSSNNSSLQEEDMMGVAADIRRQMGLIKEKVLEKLAAASVPADALDNARHYLESVVRDVTIAAHGITKDALTRIKTHLVDLLPSLSPSLTRKMVDDAEKEANGEQEEGNQPRMKASPASSFFATLAKPLSRL